MLETRSAEPVARGRRAFASLRIARCLLPASREDILTSRCPPMPIYESNAMTIACLSRGFRLDPRIPIALCALVPFLISRPRWIIVNVGIQSYGYALLAPEGTLLGANVRMGGVRAGFATARHLRPRAWLARFCAVASAFSSDDFELTRFSLFPTQQIVGMSRAATRSIVQIFLSRSAE